MEKTIHNPFLSFWEQQSFTTYDIIIVGGGIVGMSTAASLLEEDPGLRVLILERGLFPSGASTRNAGFACFGSVSELAEDCKVLGESRMLDLVKKRWEGLNILRKRLGDKGLGYKAYGGYELLREEDLFHLEQIKALNDLLKPLFKQKVYFSNPDRIDQFAFARQHIKGLIENPLEAQIDTGEMMRNLWSYVSRLGAHILTGACVDGWEIKPGLSEVLVKNPLSAFPFSLQAEKILLANNAFSSQFFPNLDIQPGRGQVLLTGEIEGLRVKGVFHLEEGYYYFRNYGNRIIFGGGRNLDFEGEQTFNMEVSDPIMRRLEEMLGAIILPQNRYSIERRWAGIMAFGKSKEPICQQVDDRLFAAVRLGGMGVAIGSSLGREMANLLLK